MKVYHFGKENGKGLSRYQIELHKAHTMARNGVLALSISVGLKVFEAMMAEEAEEKASVKGKHNKNRTIYRHGIEETSVVMGGKRLR